MRIFQVSGVEEVVDSGNNHVNEHAQPLRWSAASGRTDAELDDVYSIEFKEGDELTCEAWCSGLIRRGIRLEVGRPNGAPLIVPQRLVGDDPLVQFKGRRRRENIFCVCTMRSIAAARRFSTGSASGSRVRPAMRCRRR